MAEQSTLSSSLVDQIVDAAIEADMAVNGYLGDVASGFTHEGPYVHVTGPGGARRSGGGVATDAEGQPVQFIDGWNPNTDVYLPWRATITETFEPWLDLPDPGAFSTPTKQVFRAAEKLAMDGEHGDDGEISGGNPQLGDIGFMNSELAQFNGATVDAFSRHYAQRLPIIVNGQCSIARLLGITILAEQELWTRARADVRQVAEQVLAALQEVKAGAGSGGGSGLKALLTAAGAVAAVAGLVVSGGTAGALVAGSGTVIGLLDTFVPDAKAPKEVEVPLGGSTPQEVHQNLVAALQTLSETIADSERQLSDNMSQAHGTVIEQGRSFDLRVPALLQEDDPGRLVTPDETYVKLTTLRRIATSAMPNIARQLTDASALLGGAVDSGAWTRPAGIGLGGVGPFHPWSELREHLDGLLRDTAWEIQQAGHHLAIVCDDFEQNDVDVAERLRQHAQRIAGGSGVADHEAEVPVPPHLLGAVRGGVPIS